MLCLWQTWLEVIDVKSFDSWCRSVAHTSATKPNSGQDMMLPDGVWLSNGKCMAACRSCEREYALDFSPAELAEMGFDQDMSYCGRSQWCLP